jgi:hypothetical protein
MQMDGILNEEVMDHCIGSVGTLQWHTTPHKKHSNINTDRTSWRCWDIEF